jgi:hypothetical protein
MSIVGDQTKEMLTAERKWSLVRMTAIVDGGGGGVTMCQGMV